MKLTNAVATGAILVAIAFSPVLVHAQSAVQKTEDNKAKNIAKRDRAEKNGHPKQAVKDEKKVQHDNKELRKGK